MSWLVHTDLLNLSYFYTLLNPNYPVCGVIVRLAVGSDLLLTAKRTPAAPSCTPSPAAVVGCYTELPHRTEQAGNPLS